MRAGLAVVWCFDCVVWFKSARVVCLVLSSFGSNIGWYLLVCLLSEWFVRLVVSFMVVLCVGWFGHCGLGLVVGLDALCWLLLVAFSWLWFMLYPFSCSLCVAVWVVCGDGLCLAVYCVYCGLVVA